MWERELWQIEMLIIIVSTKDNQLGSEGVKGMSIGLKVNTALTKLNLSCEFMNEIKTTGRNNHISWIWIAVGQDNMIGADGIQFLSEALQFNTTLTELNISGEQRKAIKGSKPK